MLLLNLQPLNNELHIIAVIYNPCNYKRRYDLYWEFKDYMESCGVILHTTELTYDGNFKVTKSDNPLHLQLIGKNPLWHKENMINLTIEKLPQSCKYVGWIDADVWFDSPNWVERSIEALQNHSIIQPYQEVYSYGPDGDFARKCLSLSYVYQKLPNTLQGRLKRKELLLEDKINRINDNFTSSGFAWIARRDFLNHVGNLPNRIVTNCGDVVLGDILYDFDINKLHEPYTDLILKYRKKVREFPMLPGYLENTILYHGYHGEYKDRRYQYQLESLSHFNVDVMKHVSETEQGVYYLNDDCPQGFKDNILNHFSGRNEDNFISL